VYVTRPEDKTEDPLTWTTIGGYSSVWLRTLILAPSLQAALEVARVDATHEVAHVFNHCHHAPSGAVFDPWRWFDEATAVFVERQLCSDLDDSLRYGVYWSYRPEHALNLMNSEGGGYQAAWFLTYVVGELRQPHLIRDVWHSPDAHADSEVGPITILDRLMRWCGSCFENMFEAYAAQTYLSHPFDRNIHERFGERTLTEWICLEVGHVFDPDGPTEKLDPYGCRYYKIDVADRASALEVCVRVLQRPRSDNVRARVLLLDPNRNLVRQAALTSHGAVPPPNVTSLECVLSLAGIGAECAVLVVTNVPSPRDQGLHSYDLRREYRVRVRLT
jgi:hypothetical protein